jgi:integrase
MPKHLLTDTEVRNAKGGHPPRGSKAKAGGVYRLHDGEGLALCVMPSGVKSWQYRYKLGDREQTATIGKYPRVSLVDARKRAEELRALAESGEHLTIHKHATRAQKQVDAALTFETFAKAWVDREARRERWTPDYAEEVRASLRNHLSDLNRLPLTKITAPLIAPLLLAVEKSSPYMLPKVRRRLRAILDEAVEHGILAGNPMPTPRRRKSRGGRSNYPAITDLRALGEVLRAARSANPSKGVHRAHTLIAFTGLRVSEVTGARWDEFELDGVEIPIPDDKHHRSRLDPDAGNWTVPRERMKIKDDPSQPREKHRGPHVVPLPPRLLARLRTWRAEDGPDAVYVCPSPNSVDVTITPEGVEKFYRVTLGLAGRHSPHSWRSSLKSIASDAGKNSEVVEAQLDHVVGSAVASKYDRAKRLELRRELMTWYEDRLITARDGATVLELGAKKA